MGIKKIKRIKRIKRIRPSRKVGGYCSTPRGYKSCKCRKKRGLPCRGRRPKFSGRKFHGKKAGARSFLHKLFHKHKKGHKKKGFFHRLKKHISKIKKKAHKLKRKAAKKKKIFKKVIKKVKGMKLAETKRKMRVKRMRAPVHCPMGAPRPATCPGSKKKCAYRTRYFNYHGKKCGRPYNDCSNCKGKVIT